MKKIIIALLMFVTFAASAMIADSERVWREHIITDATTQQTMSLVGSFQHPEFEDQSLPYVLHIAAMERHQAFYMNLSSMIDNIHPNTPIVVDIGHVTKSYQSQNHNINGIAETIRVSDSTVTMKLFTYDELNTCTGNYKNLVESEKISINYVTTAGDVRDINLNTAGLINTMQHVYKIPDSCNQVTSDVVVPAQAEPVQIDWLGMIITGLMFVWVIFVSIKAKERGRRTWVWFLFGFMLTPIASHITLYFLSKKSSKTKEV